MASPYLDQPLFPLGIALPRMLAQVEAEAAAALPDEELRLARRVELLRGLLLTRSDPAGQASVMADER
jgi:hypothetical protein